MLSPERTLFPEASGTLTTVEHKTTRVDDLSLLARRLEQTFNEDTDLPIADRLEAAQISVNSLNQVARESYWGEKVRMQGTFHVPAKDEHGHVIGSEMIEDDYIYGHALGFYARKDKLELAQDGIVIDDVQRVEIGHLVQIGAINHNGWSDNTTIYYRAFGAVNSASIRLEEQIDNDRLAEAIEQIEPGDPYAQELDRIIMGHDDVDEADTKQLHDFFQQVATLPNGKRLTDNYLNYMNLVTEVHNRQVDVVAPYMYLPEKEDDISVAFLTKTATGISRGFCMSKGYAVDVDGQKMTARTEDELCVAMEVRMGPEGAPTIALVPLKAIEIYQFVR